MVDDFFYLFVLQQWPSEQMMMIFLRDVLIRVVKRDFRECMPDLGLSKISPCHPKKETFPCRVAVRMDDTGIQVALFAIGVGGMYLDTYLL